MHAQVNMLLTLKRQHMHNGPSMPQSRRTKERLDKLITRMDSELKPVPTLPETVIYVAQNQSLMSDDSPNMWT